MRAYLIGTLVAIEVQDNEKGGRWRLVVEDKETLEAGYAGSLNIDTGLMKAWAAVPKNSEVIIPVEGKYFSIKSGPSGRVTKEGVGKLPKRPIPASTWHNKDEGKASSKSGGSEEEYDDTPLDLE